MPQDLKKYGYTVGCQGCESVELGHEQRRNHSEVCRRRIEEAMEASEADRDRLQRTKDRIDYRTAKAGEDIMGPEEPKIVHADVEPDEKITEHDNMDDKEPEELING